MKSVCSKSSNYSISHNAIDVVALKNELELLEIPYAIISDPEEPIRLSKVLQYPLKAKPAITFDKLENHEVLHTADELVTYLNRKNVIVSDCYPLILTLDPD